MDKIIVYACTRNLYDNAIICANSALRNGGIDKVFILAEDDTLPNLPERAEVINVSDQPYIKKGGPNAIKYWTYMSLMRVAYTKYFPDYDRIVSLDCDTIVEKDITALWDIDLSGYYFAGVEEPRKSERQLYINAGVLVQNLALLRADGMDDILIKALNTRDFNFADQGAINEKCAGKILKLKGRYNVSRFTEYDSETYIRHFAATEGWAENYKQYSF